MNAIAHLLPCALLLSCVGTPEEPGDGNTSAPETTLVDRQVCDAIEREYEETITSPHTTACEEETDRCQVLHGHCGVGLGGCSFAANTRVHQAELDAIASRWTRAQCHRGRSVCRCAAPPPVRCVAGTCRMAR